MNKLMLLIPAFVAGLLSGCSDEYHFDGKYELAGPNGSAIEVLELAPDSTFWFYGKDAQNTDVPAIWSCAGTWSLHKDTVLLSSYEDEMKIPLADGAEWTVLGFSPEDSEQMDYYPLPLSRKYGANNGFLYSPETQTTLKKPGAGKD